jgi:pyruvate kinase
VTRALALFWGVAPVLMAQRADDAATMFDRALDAATQNGLVAAGDLVVLTGGAPVGVPGTTNLLQVRSIGRVVCRGTGIGGAVVVGPIRHLEKAADVEKIGPGDVVVAVSGDTPGFVAALTRAAGAVVEVGGLTTAAAITALAIPRPIIVGAQGAHTLLEEGAVVTLDLRRGLVYAGTVRVDASST